MTLCLSRDRLILSVIAGKNTAATSGGNAWETNWYVPKKNMSFLQRSSSAYNYVKVCHPARVCVPALVQ